MRLFAVENWLKSPADRDIIARWTLDDDPATAISAEAHTLILPPLPPENAAEWEFLALGDTGDADAAGPGVAPQDAVAQQLARDAASPVGQGAARMVLHTGDVIYMTGERRLYDRNFRRPYAPFLTPESTVDNLVFRLPFLPVPGNHDYYDLGVWARWLGRVPILGAGLRAIAHELFAFNVPEGGSDMGRAYMEAFVDLNHGTAGKNAAAPGVPLAYTPGARTRIPNRYYQFRCGVADANAMQADFFALDSNTLDAPPPEAGVRQVRQDAASRVGALEDRAHELDRELRRSQLARDAWAREQRQAAAQDAARLADLKERGARVAALLAGLRERLARFAGEQSPAVAAIRRAEHRWTEGAADLAEAPLDNAEGAAAAITEMDEASDEACAALRKLDEILADLPEANPARSDLLNARGEINRALSDWSARVAPPPEDLDVRLRQLSEEALDVQRELALERRRLRYRPEDHDTRQLTWLDAALSRSCAERPNAWRILYLHHPLYTTIGNHCERPDVQDLRENLLGVLKGRVDLIFSGHSHAFEWFRSDALPGVGLFVSGGGGQISLRPSILDPRQLRRRRDRYEALVRAGVAETAAGGYGPPAGDGEDGPIYHYLRVRLTPEKAFITPVGVRRLASGGFRREEPMPVFHSGELGAGRPGPVWQRRRLEQVEVGRNGRGVIAHWTR